MPGMFNSEHSEVFSIAKNDLQQNHLESAYSDYCIIFWINCVKMCVRHVSSVGIHCRIFRAIYEGVNENRITVYSLN